MNCFECDARVKRLYQVVNKKGSLKIVTAKDDGYCIRCARLAAGHRDNV